MPDEVTEADALADIQRVAEELGTAPTVAQYREHGEYSARTVSKRFGGSFVDAREAAGVSEGEIRPNSREELLADIRHVADAVAGEPSRDDYHEHGEYALSGITYRFESWIVAKKEAGVYDPENHGPTKEMLIEDMQRVDGEVNGPLTQKNYTENGNWVAMSVKRRFESWESACQEAGVSRPKMGPQPVPTEALLADIRRVAEIVGDTPAKNDYREHGRFSQQFAMTRLGSWSEAVRVAGFEPFDPGGLAGERHWNFKGGYNQYYGPNYHEQRRKARKRDGFECRMCGMSDERHKELVDAQLDMHHIVPAREFGDDYEAMNQLSNLLTLCTWCHGKLD